MIGRGRGVSRPEPVEQTDPALDPPRSDRARPRWVPPAGVVIYGLLLVPFWGTWNEKPEIPWGEFFGYKVREVWSSFFVIGLGVLLWKGVRYGLLGCWRVVRALARLALTACSSPGLGVGDGVERDGARRLPLEPASD